MEGKANGRELGEGNYYGMNKILLQDKMLLWDKKMFYGMRYVVRFYGIGYYDIIINYSGRILCDGMYLLQAHKVSSTYSFLQGQKR